MEMVLNQKVMFTMKMLDKAHLGLRNDIIQSVI